MIVATNGSETGRVRLSHWWPGRVCRLPNVNGRLWRRCLEGKTRYLTVFSAELPDGLEITASARCYPGDRPKKEKGRFIALLRLARALRAMGWRLERVS
jgi:hypothetical protein